MRKTSFGLGLAGGILAILIAVLIAIAMALVSFAINTISSFDSGDLNSLLDDVDISIENDDVDVEISGFLDEVDINVADYFEGYFADGFNVFSPSFLRMMSGWVWFIAIGMLVGGILAIIGASISKRRKSVLAGVFLIVAAVPCFFSIIGILAGLLLIPSGILAFIKSKEEKESVIET